MPHESTEDTVGQGSKDDQCSDQSSKTRGMWRAGGPREAFFTSLGQPWPEGKSRLPRCKGSCLEAGRGDEQIDWRKAGVPDPDTFFQIFHKVNARHGLGWGQEGGGRNVSICCHRV